MPKWAEAWFEDTAELIRSGKHRYILRFAVVGILNTGVDFAVFSILKGLFGVHYGISQVAGYSAGILNSFVINKLWTFEIHGVDKKTPLEFARFLVVNAVSLGVSLLGLDLLGTGSGMNIYLAKAIVTVIAQVINFAGYRFWVFATGKKQ